MFVILEELYNTALHGGDASSESRGSRNPGLVASNLDLLLTELVFPVLVAHCQDCVRHQDETLEVGFVRNPDRCWVSVNPVCNDSTPDLVDMYWKGKTR